MLDEQDFELARETFGEDHHKTLKSLDNMAYYYSLQKRYNKAEPLFVQVLERRRAVLEAWHNVRLPQRPITREDP